MKTFNFVDLIVAPFEERIDHVAASHDIFSSNISEQIFGGVKSNSHWRKIKECY